MSQSAKNIKANTGKFWAHDAIFDRRDLNSTQKLILLNLHRRADKNGECRPGQARIAQDCGFKSHATVQRNTPGLIEAGVLKAKRGRSGYRYVLVPHDKWPAPKPDSSPAVTLPEPPKMKLKVASNVSLSNITKRPKVAQRKTQEGRHKKDHPPTPLTKPTNTEREAQPSTTEGREGFFSKIDSIIRQGSIQHEAVGETPSIPQLTDAELKAWSITEKLVYEFEQRGKSFSRVRSVVQRYRDRGLNEQLLQQGLQELEKTRQTVGLRSPHVLLSEHIFPRLLERQENPQQFLSRNKPLPFQKAEIETTAAAATKVGEKNDQRQRETIQAEQQRRREQAEFVKLPETEQALWEREALILLRDDPDKDVRGCYRKPPQLGLENAYRLDIQTKAARLYWQHCQEQSSREPHKEHRS